MRRPALAALCLSLAAPAAAQDADAAFAALDAAATRGVAGTNVTTAGISRGDGCALTYSASQAVGPTVLTATFTFDPAALDLEHPDSDDDILMDPAIEVRTIVFGGIQPDTPGVDRIVTAPADTDEQRTFFEENIPGGSCDDSGCTYVIEEGEVILLALDDDRDAQEGAIISALKEFVAVCGG
ncbi:hypothetical protein [Wenxinia marina]|uniref:Uncharacterized protein n=1 Tax=Wenxinia marina DSM 24838 TaxID=1123501 RepID=A0A0D0QFV8_9RHOB|nr:hypothetical protein [Wenxinia marina]KIQ69918.1 hypothetical protein Wenmar_01488 [Wenxinia marina DSM 24838]GGL62187.1 hypothetical protein GCM10011392_15910 [Wenxinia marina]